MVVSLGAALVSSATLALFAPPWVSSMVRFVACYDAAAMSMLAWYWSIVLRTNARETKARAASQDPGLDAVFVVVLCAAAFGFVAAFAILGRGTHDRIMQQEILIYALALSAVVLGWLLIHTIFLFRYAHLYYGDRDRNQQSDGGLVFPGGGSPNYHDLAYFSFVLGMTFQVSDVQIAAPGIRRVALAHAMISFGYNTAILALVVNVVSNLLH